MNDHGLNVLNIFGLDASAAIGRAALTTMDHEFGLGSGPRCMYNNACLLSMPCAVSYVTGDHAAALTVVEGPKTSVPSQNLGKALPGMKCLSTLSFVMTHIRMVPPEEPSRDIARARADQLLAIEQT